MPFSTVIVGLAERDGDDDAMALAFRLVDPGGAELLPIHVDARHRLGAVAADRLADAVTRHAADLVVVGSGRRTPPGRLSPTRTAMHLLEHAVCPVAIAPSGYREAGPFRHIGVAYDGGAEAEQALDLAYALAARDHAAVTLYLTILDGRLTYAGAEPPQLDTFAQRARMDAQEALDAAAERAPAGVNPETVMMRGAPSTDIASAADGVVDLLVSGSRGLGGLRRALGASVSEQLLLSSTVPMLVVPPPAGGH